MAKFEYDTMILEIGYNTDGSIAYGPPSPDNLNEMAEKGWRVVTATDKCVIFERPKDEN